jgi:hypothetical protein
MASRAVAKPSATEFPAISALREPHHSAPSANTIVTVPESGGCWSISRSGGKSLGNPAMTS